MLKACEFCTQKDGFGRSALGLNGKALVREPKAERPILQARLDSRSWVEEIAQGIANEIKCEDREHHRDCWKNHEMRCVEQMRAGVV